MHIPKLIIIAALFIVVFLMFGSISRNISDPTNYILSKMSYCYKQKGIGSCYKNITHDFLAHIPLATIFKVFQENETREEIFASCHEVMHYVGRHVYEQEGKVGTALSKCSSVCFEGCLHGVVEGYVLKKNISLDAIANEIPNMCGKISDYDKPELFNQCIHGIGHAVMLLTQNEVPDSLKLCDVLKTREESELCYSGVFMENSNSSTNKDHPSKYVKKDDPFYPCAILDKKYKKMCYELQSFKAFEFENKDWMKTFALCNSIPSEYQSGCYKSLGSSQVGFTQDVMQMKQNCDMAPAQYRNICDLAIVSTLSTRYSGDSSKMIAFCLIVDLQSKKNCYSQMGASIRGWNTSQNKLRAICSKIPETLYRKWCEKPVSVNNMDSSGNP